MLELYNAIYWRLVNEKDTVVNAPRIDGQKLSTYIGTSDFRIYGSYDDIARDGRYPGMVITINSSPEGDRPETVRCLVQIFFFTTSEKSVYHFKTQLENFFRLVDYFIGEYYEKMNDFSEVKDDEDNYVIKGKWHVESFKYRGSTPFIFNPNEKNYQLSTRWEAILTRDE
jgi:hypothetical protein